MLRRCTLRFPKREAGYAFWRSRSRLAVERQSKIPLLQERPYPIAEIARRMVKIRCKHEDSADMTERSLLRGEYKFFTGKLCEFHNAATADLIAVVECAAFFGFHDVQLLSRVEALLTTRVSGMHSIELLILYRSLPTLGKLAAYLYMDVCERLAHILRDLTLDERVELLERAHPEHTPAALLLATLDATIHLVDELAPEQVVDVLRGLALLPADVLRINKEWSVRDAARTAFSLVLDVMRELNTSELADAARYGAMLGLVTEPAELQPWTQRFVMTATTTGDDRVASSAVATMLEVARPIDPAFVFLARDLVEDTYHAMTSSELVDTLRATSAALDVTGLPGKLQLAAPAPHPRRLSFAEEGELIRLMNDVVTHTGFTMNDTDHFRSAAEALGCLDALAGIHRQRLPRLPAFYPCVQQACGRLIVLAPGMNTREAAQFLRIASAMQTQTLDAALRCVLERVSHMVPLLDPSEAAELLRELQPLPPLPTVHARTMMQQRLLPMLLRRADGLDVVGPDGFAARAS